MQTYERIKEQIFSQNIEGKYVRHSRTGSALWLLFLGGLCLALGVVSLFTFLNLNSTEIFYSSNLSTPIFLSQGMHYLYIKINGLHQNNLAYSKSISYKQLSGETKDLNLKDCFPFDYRNNKVVYPAGAIANTYFQDIIKLEGLSIASENIAWNAEKEVIGQTKYTRNQIEIPQAWTNDTNIGTKPLNFSPKSAQADLPILNERFVNWIYLSAFSNFNKLWGIVNVEKKGVYNLEIESVFDICKKGILIAESSWLGVKNFFIPYMLIAIGLVCAISAIILRKIPGFD